MLFRKKKQGKKSYALKLEKYFDIGDAEDSYRLVRREYDKKGKSTGGFVWLGAGDKKWANKIANHYNLKITVAPSIEEEY